MRRKIRSRRGFTLVEVLAVAAAVLLILLAIAIPSVMGAIDHARHKHDAEVERAAAAALTAMGGLSTPKVDFPRAVIPPMGSAGQRGTKENFCGSNIRRITKCRCIGVKHAPAGLLSHHGIQSSAAPDCPLIRQPSLL